MAGKANTLTARAVANAKHPGTHKRPVRIGDGGGLYLQIAAGGSKSWLFRFRLREKDREMGLGAADPEGRSGGVTLAEAREKAATARKLMREGVDPIDARQDEAEARKAADAAATLAASPRTFKSVTEAFLTDREGGWSNPKHRAQWEATLRTLAFPALGKMPVERIGTEDVLNVLRGIWTQTPETASRLRGRIEAVLNFARVRGWREGENPARWRGHLDHMLANPRKVKRPEHRPALPWREMPAFMAAMLKREGVAIHALAFAILTAARTGEVRLARWREIDREQAVWTVPAARMKARKVHRVPLSPAALAVLDAVAPLAKEGESLIFPSAMREGAALSDMTLSAVIRRMNEEAGGELPRWRDAEGRAVVPHGFRSTFRDWAGETRPEGREVAEAALAHAIKGKAEAAYARSDLLEKRRPLMNAWGEWCGKAPAEVVKLPGAKAG
ncbi:site-specific integrase [Roseomonas sp. M0104]|uniref:Site-specific integrase n=2 Tax=Teichococcus coralli TaxID=2545983 RepID=A0A845B9Z1_9PROT|nr:site-specific integrase [Pseudoroseomonas coralli]MXP63408.1 site-specific integrase [Pseudoroseomonas coralli]